MYFYGLDLGRASRLFAAFYPILDRSDVISGTAGPVDVPEGKAPRSSRELTRVDGPASSGGGSNVANPIFARRVDGGVQPTGRFDTGTDGKSAGEPAPLREKFGPVSWPAKTSTCRTNDDLRTDVLRSLRRGVNYKAAWMDNESYTHTHTYTHTFVKGQRASSNTFQVSFHSAFTAASLFLALSLAVDDFDFHRFPSNVRTRVSSTISTQILHGPAG